MKYSNLVFAFCLVLFSQCKDNSLTPVTPPDPALKIMGIPGQSKTYYVTAADFIQGSNEPFIVPPDSLKSLIQFPESLYSQGIFVYGNLTEQCWFSHDTLVVQETEEGYNLFTEIYGRVHHFTMDGWFQSGLWHQYFVSDGDIYDRILGGGLDIVYDLPLEVGKVYQSTFSGATFSVVSQDTITTRAGSFSTFKIQINGRWGYTTETHYVSPEYGLILADINYGANNTSLPWDSANVQAVVQIQRRELISIK